MQMSSNLNSKKTVLPKPENILDEKTISLEMDQTSNVTALASSTTEKCATSEPLLTKDSKVESEVKPLDELDAPEV